MLSVVQAGIHLYEPWITLLLELTRGVELPQRLSTWAGEVICSGCSPGRP